MQLARTRMLPAVAGKQPGLTGRHPALLARDAPPFMQYFKQDGRENDVSILLAPRFREGKLLPCSTRMSIRSRSISVSFAFFGKVPRSILYDNTKLAVARILGDGMRQRTRVFSELQSHYVFADRFGRPGKGNDKGKVEGLIGWIRRNLLVPVPRAASFTALNEQLLEGCRRRLGDRLRGHEETIGERSAPSSRCRDSAPAIAS